MTDSPPISPDPPRRRLVLDVDIGAEPLSGVLYAGGTSHPFCGWLALASAIDRVSSAASAEEPSVPSGLGSHKN